MFKMKSIPELCVEQMKNRHVYLTEDKKRGWRNKEGAPTNLLIECENYHGLSILEYTHASKIKVQIVDMPYGTGNKDFVYNDDFTYDAPDGEESDVDTGTLSYVNSKDSQRHSKWESWAERRMRKAYNLMTPDGVVIFHIDDHNMPNLMFLCYATFGEENVLPIIVWKKKSGGDNNAKFIAGEHEYIIICAKDIDECVFNRIPQNVDYDPSYKYEDKWVGTRGKYKTRNLDDPSIQGDRPNLRYPIICPDGSEVVGERWRWSQDKVKWGIAHDRIEFKKVKGVWNVYLKQYQFEDNDGNKIERSDVFRSVIDDVLGATGTKELIDIMGSKLFDYPKPVELVKRFVRLCSSKNDILLDWCAGSGTMGQAVQEVNREDGGNRQFILLTNNEKSDKLPNGIARDLTYPRLQKTISNDTNLVCMKVVMLKHDKSPHTSVKVEQLERNNRLVPILKVKHNAYRENITTDKYLILQGEGDYYLGIYFNYTDPPQPPLGMPRAAFQKKVDELSDNNDVVFNVPGEGYASQYFAYMQATNSRSKS